MNKRRIVITGLGMLTPVGNSTDQSWKNILAGNSGIDLINHFNTENFNTKICGVISNLVIEDYIPHKEIKKMDPFIHYGIIAGTQAMEDSGLMMDEVDATRVGVAVSSGIGGLSSIENGTELYLKGGARKISPFYIPSSIINMVAGHLSIKYGAKGPSFSVVAACTTGAHSIGNAARIIQYGDADVMIAGGVEMASSPTGIAGFMAARALSTRNDEPQRASRPWDKDRDGFVLSDGAGVIILEEYTHAKKRDAKIYAELVGYGMSSDAYHMTAPLADGSGAADCMLGALRDANIALDKVDYINAHGTSTPTGDIAETVAIKRVFSSHAKKIAVSSTKSMIGHLLGAAGGVEAIFSVLALRDQVAPPTINLDTPDPGCDLDYVPHEARPMNIDVVLSNSFGFGGSNATLAFKRI